MSKGMGVWKDNVDSRKGSAEFSHSRWGLLCARDWIIDVPGPYDFPQALKMAVCEGSLKSVLLNPNYHLSPEGPGYRNSQRTLYTRRGSPQTQRLFAFYSESLPVFKSHSFVLKVWSSRPEIHSKSSKTTERSLDTRPGLFVFLSGFLPFFSAGLRILNHHLEMTLN